MSLPHLLPGDLEARVWRTYFSRHVLPSALTIASRRHFSNSVVSEIAERGQGMGRMWRAFVSSDNVVIGVSRTMDDGMSETDVRRHVAHNARKHVIKSPTPVEPSPVW